jgi:apolipoprotein D and lipocalin family protein
LAAPILAFAGSALMPATAETFAGRWYEVARTPNKMQRDCRNSTTEFEDRGGGSFMIVETCFRGSGPDGSKVVRAKARLLSDGDSNRFRLSLLGGLVHQDYVILDRADDDGWLLMGTPGGRYVWILSRRPALPPAILAAAVNRAGALGFPASRLVYPSQNGG